jgi:hypothetical protein
MADGRFVVTVLSMRKILAAAFIIWLMIPTFSPAQIFRIEASKDHLLVLGKNENASLKIIELAPNESLTNAFQRGPIASVSKKGKFKISISRFDGERDRIYSGFTVVSDHSPTNTVRFVEQWNNVSKFRETYPTAKSKKGLQVQMVDDAIALGVKHAALNFNLGHMVALHPDASDFAWKMDGRTFHFHRSFIEHTDTRIKTLSDAGMLITLILLNYEGTDAELNKILLHPNYDPKCAEHLSAFNTSTSEGLAWFKACIEFLADRYSEPQQTHGRVVNYIVGNEVNSHSSWANMGPVSMEQFAEDYLRTVRVCHAAVRKFSSSARVFVSLEHHWNIRSAGGNEKQTFAGRPFVEYCNQMAKAGGDFPWNIAFHPYPEDLFECRTWNDKSATLADDTPRITFKNIELLPRYFQKKDLLCHGEPRHIVLSEQGFHSRDTADGETNQAAAYCYAYAKIAKLDGIEAFILHRHVDHGGEYGLNLGLWRRKKVAGSLSDPESKKPIYEVFRLADTPQWKEAFAFALPIIGIKAWREIEPREQ